MKIKIMWYGTKDHNSYLLKIVQVFWGYNNLIFLTMTVAFHCLLFCFEVIIIHPGLITGEISHLLVVTQLLTVDVCPIFSIFCCEYSVHLSCWFLRLTKKLACGDPLLHKPSFCPCLQMRADSSNAITGPSVGMIYSAHWAKSSRFGNWAELVEHLLLIQTMLPAVVWIQSWPEVSSDGSHDLDDYYS